MLRVGCHTTQLNSLHGCTSLHGCRQHAVEQRPPDPAPNCSPALQSTLRFATLQQAQAASDMFAQRGPDGRPGATTSLVSLPLHAPPELFFPPAPVPPQLPEVLPMPQPQPQPAVPMPQLRAPPVAHVPQQAPPAIDRPPLPPGMRFQPPPHAQQQQQREGVGATMRPLYAAPRPGHAVRRGLASALPRACCVQRLP